MDISYDEEKRRKTLDERGLDFDDAALVLDDTYIVQLDDRRPYSEQRFLTYGFFARSFSNVCVDPD